MKKSVKKNAPGLQSKAPKLHAHGVARAPKVNIPSPETKKTLKP